MSQNDEAWEKIFTKYDILKRIKTCGQFVISAKQIKEYREPRLMTKFDHKVNLPKIFADNNLSILPISRGDYVISSFKAYKEFESDDILPQKVSVPLYLKSLAPNFIVSETIALNCAYACGILNDFLEDENLVSTVNGRMGSGSFKFNIDTILENKEVCVENSQIEIDAAYEGKNYLSIFEAKRDLSTDFLVRQLYYPFRVWQSKVNKPIKTVFLIFSNGLFQLFEYKFEDPKNYNSLTLVKRKNYILSTDICKRDIIDILRNTIIQPEPQIPFPQANSMERVVNLLELLTERLLTKDEISYEYEFNVRQAYYYTDAGIYLGLINKSKNADNNTQYSLSSLGEHIMNLNLRERQLSIIECLLKHKVFHNCIEFYFENNLIPSTDEIVKIMENSNLYNLESEVTIKRRSSTVLNWIKWVIKTISD